jgi:uncharacterized protein (TIGR03437 family)
MRTTGRIALAVFLCLLFAAASDAASVNLGVINRVPGPVTGGDPAPNACEPGPAVNTIQDTDAYAVAYLLINAMAPGDILALQWVKPDGQVYTSTSWAPLAEGGDWCFAAWSQVADTPMVNFPGAWQARFLLNGVLFHTLSFTLAGSGGTPSCTFSLDESARHFGAAGGTGRVYVGTNLPSCLWVPQSTAAWLTFLPGEHMGSAAVDYAVAANTSTSSRQASLILGTQSFTVSQDGASSGGTGGSCPATGTNLLQNPSFELPGLASGNLEVVAGNPFIPNWAVTSGVIDYVALWAASDGQIALDLNALVTGSVGQSFSTVPGGSYTVCFDMAGNPAGGPTLKSLRVTAAGIGQTYSFDISGKSAASMGWLTKVWTFQATGSQTTLDFASTVGGAYGPAIDNIRVYGQAGGGGATGGGNELRNPGSEESPAQSCTGSGAIPGWNTDGRVAVCRYGTGDYTPKPTSPGPPDRGEYLFIGGASSSRDAQMSQDVDISKYSAQIDAGTLPYTLSGWLGGWDEDRDNARVTLRFLGGTGGTTQLGSIQIGPVMPADRLNRLGLVERTGSGNVPAGTRTARVIVDFDYRTGSDNDAYVDNLSLVFDTSSGGGGGGGGTDGCNYFINPESQSVPGTGGENLVLVTTGTTCEWTAVSNVTWITVIAGSPGKGGGGVSYRVDPNPSASPRTGTITIGDRTFTVNQGAADPCTFTISPTSATVAAAGGAGSVSVNVSASSCSWTASTGAGWVSITAGSSGTGNGTVQYSAAANANPTSRTATITIAGRTFTIDQDAAGAAGGLVLSGAVNAASYIPSGLPGGALAQGSFFSLFGQGIGPNPWLQATNFPLPTSGGLGGVTVEIRKGGQSVFVVLHFVSTSQINGIIPSNAPLGECIMVVTFNGQSAQMPVQIVKHNFGAFSLQAGRGPGIVQNWNSQTDAPLNTSRNPARRGQIGVLWGTGLGPITTADNQAPPVGNLPYTVEITVGGLVSEKTYWGRAPGAAGVDNIYFIVPANAPYGCFVPVQVKVEGMYSNTVTMAIGDPGMECGSNSDIPFIGMAEVGGKTGAVVILTALVDADIEADNERDIDPIKATAELGLGIFLDAPGSGATGDQVESFIPPLGSCQSGTGTEDITALLEGASGLLGGGLLGGGGGSLPPGTEVPEYAPLDAGPKLRLQGPAGGRDIPLADEESPGIYLGILGVNLMEAPADVMQFSAFLPPPFLTPGSYNLTSPGGANVGPIDTTFNIPQPVIWTNRDQLQLINRNQGVAFSWSGGTTDQIILMGGLSAEEDTGVIGGFLCLEGAAKGQFTVPASATSNMPLASAVAGFDDNGAALALAVVPIKNYHEFLANGLDRGLVINGNIEIITTGVQ